MRRIAETPLTLSSFEVVNDVYGCKILTPTEGRPSEELYQNILDIFSDCVRSKKNAYCVCDVSKNEDWLEHLDDIQKFMDTLEKGLLAHTRDVAISFDIAIDFEDRVGFNYYYSLAFPPELLGNCSRLGIKLVMTYYLSESGT